MTFQSITYSVADHVAQLTLNRPERLNALNQPLTDALLAYFEARRRDTECRLIVLAAAGRAFCSGADLKAGGQPDALRDGPNGDWTLVIPGAPSPSAAPQTNPNAILRIRFILTNSSLLPKIVLQSFHDARRYASHPIPN